MFENNLNISSVYMYYLSLFNFTVLKKNKQTVEKKLSQLSFKLWSMQLKCNLKLKYIHIRNWRYKYIKIFHSQLEIKTRVKQKCQFCSAILNVHKYIFSHISINFHLKKTERV